MTFVVFNHLGNYLAIHDLLSPCSSYLSGKFQTDDDDDDDNDDRDDDKQNISSCESININP